MSVKELVRETFAAAGIAINGENTWDPQVHDERFYKRVVKQGSLGLGESYMDSWWDCERLDEFFHRFVGYYTKHKSKLAWSLICHFQFRPILGNLSREVQAIIRNNQSKQKAGEVAETHYDIGNDLFSAILDKRITYSCAYWKNAATLDEAQEAKLDLICRKLQLEHGMNVLDIGCGWGSFIKYAAERYGVRCVGINRPEAKQQIEFAKESCKGLPVQVFPIDYRNSTGSFDRIISVGMFEHVGAKNYLAYMEAVRRCLTNDGLSLLHTIVSNGDHPSRAADPWIAKYIFSNGVLPSSRQICRAILGGGESIFTVADWHCFGDSASLRGEPHYYDRTLMAWHENFTRNWDKISSSYGQRVGGRFYRMWRYYLLCCAGGVFRSKNADVHQIVFSKHPVPYTPIR